MEGISKAFSGVPALTDVELKVRRGTVHALMGENGAGKSTMMKILLGIYMRDQGTVRFNGREVHYKSPNPDKPEKFILYFSPLCYSKEKGGFHHVTYR